MAKIKTQYVCQQCGRISPRMMGRCPRCGEFNTMVEMLVEEPRASQRRPASLSRSEPQRLRDVTNEAEPRVQLPMQEFSRVLGGGVVPGSLVLLGGDPGIGKST